MSISRGTHVVYTARPGDTLYAIANAFGTSVQSIIEANAWYPPITEADLLFPGQKLLIRLPGMAEQSTVFHQVTAGDTMYGLAQRYSVGLELLAAVNQMERPDILQVARLVNVLSFVYEVEQGDSLYRISRRLGTPISVIARANSHRPGFSPDLLYPGFQLVIPLPSSTNIAVFEPLPGTIITSGQQLIGVARAFEANVLYQIRDNHEQIIARERFVTASEGAPAFGQFQAQLQFDRQPATTSGTLWVYTRSARDGSIQDLVEVEIGF